MAEGDRTRLDRTPSLWAARSLARLRRAAAISALTALVILAWAPMKEILQPWRRTQARYNALASAYDFPKREAAVHQIWLPAAEKADRCGSCHLGAVGETPLEEYPPFGSHPQVPHSPETFGCTYCHAGQGWATVADDAHGRLGTWAHPIFDRSHTQAGCGTCHSGLTLPLPEDIEDAADLVDEYGCLKCHAETTDSRQAAPTLRGIGLRGVPKAWASRHRGLSPPDDETSALVNAGAGELATLDAWLTTRVGAPHLARGKMVFHQLGCLGCHRRGGVGGDVGPDLTRVGDKDAREIGGEQTDSGTLPAWLLEHLLTPQALDRQSRMPPIDREELEAESDPDSLVTYLLSLREEAIPPPFTPPDRARIDFGLGRDLPSTGRGLYVSFCSACHGFYATGKELETLELLAPMIGTRGYLATVTPRYLRSSILRGRRGRYMPAWGPEDGGLSDLEVDRIVDYLVSRGSRIKDFEQLEHRGEPARGRRVFERRCIFCHVSSGEESSSIRFGRDLLAQGALRHFTDEVLYQSIVRGWVEEGMPSFAFLKPADLADLLAFLEPGSSGANEFSHDALHSHFGNQIWEAKCSECHGRRGEGSSNGPMLNTDPYLGWANDDYLAARTGDHRGKIAKATVGTLSEDDLDAVLDFVRSWSGRVEPATPAHPTPDAIARGRDLYPSRCTECHGNAGRGKTGPALANRDFLELVSRPFLVMTILEGRKGTAMQAWRQRTELPVTLQDAFDLTDYILSLAKTGERTANTSPSPGTNSNQGG